MSESNSNSVFERLPSEIQARLNSLESAGGLPALREYALRLAEHMLVGYPRYKSMVDGVRIAARQNAAVDYKAIFNSYSSGAAAAACIGMRRDPAGAHAYFIAFQALRPCPKEAANLASMHALKHAASAADEHSDIKSENPPKRRWDSSYPGADTLIALLDQLVEAVKSGDDFGKDGPR